MLIFKHFFGNKDCSYQEMRIINGFVGYDLPWETSRIEIHFMVAKI